MLFVCHYSIIKANDKLNRQKCSHLYRLYINVLITTIFYQMMIVISWHHLSLGDNGTLF